MNSSDKNCFATVLRSRSRNQNDIITSLCGSILLENCDNIADSFSDLIQAKEIMSEIMESLDTHFIWLKGLDGVTKLFFLQDKKLKKSLHPWVEVKKVDVSGEFSYGLFASSKFKTV